VPMLLDSGADLTLVQRSSVDQLGALVEPDTAYEVYAFDGTVTFAQAVELDLVFLDRIFRGTYLITDQSIGILGRDVLNHVRVLLDGPALPALQWNEQTDQPVQLLKIGSPFKEISDGSAIPDRTFQT